MHNGKAAHTFEKGKQFSRKLKKRLTQRTVAEAKALKKQSKEAIHILVYATELVSEPVLSILWSPLVPSI